MRPKAAKKGRSSVESFRRVFKEYYRVSRSLIWFAFEGHPGIFQAKIGLFKVIHSSPTQAGSKVIDLRGA